MAFGKRHLLTYAHRVARTRSTLPLRESYGGQARADFSPFPTWGGDCWAMQASTCAIIIYVTEIIIYVTE